MHHVVAELRRMRWLAKLGDEDLDFIANRGVVMVATRNQTIFAAGEESNDVYLILSGRVRVIIHESSGREIGFRELETGEGVGEMAMIDGAPRMASALTMDGARLFKISGPTFRMLLLRYPPLAEAIIQSLVGIVRRMTARLAESRESVRVRVVMEVVRMAEMSEVTDGSRIVIRHMPTDEQLASRLWTHREAVNRVIGELRRRQLVERRGRHLLVDLDGTRRHLDQLRGEARDEAVSPAQS